ncbi:MAG: PIG-L family deacetylase [Kiritimatiellae bacterium]|nr:PIG-L family deacetylase [Kiritimatiellia bacterium]
MQDRVLAFGCHPDDVEFMAAGTLALLAERGYEIHTATMTGGEVGSPALSRAEIHAVRLKEAAAAAAVIGAHYHYAGGCDLEVEYNEFYRRAATRIVREVDPFIVLTNPPMDYLADHEQTSLLVRNAAYIASVPLYDCGTSAPPTKRFPYLFYWNAMGLKDIFGRPLPLHCVIDVGAAMATKEKMLACHASQRDWLAAHNKMDSYIQTMKELSRGHGRLIGREHGEGFIQHRGHGYPADNILASILPGVCKELPVRGD